MRLYSESQVRSAVTPDEVIQAIRSAFARGFAALRMPVRTTLELDGALLLVMPCYDQGLNAAGVKLVSVSAKSGVHATYELLDPATGISIARMEADYLTDSRNLAYFELSGSSNDFWYADRRVLTSRVFARR
jgi:ornithine cyclodeaminase/alanine dehydrogenase-like protein (mu-crystallin family)